MCKFCKKVKNKTWIALIIIATAIYCIAVFAKDADFATGLVSAFALAFVVAELFIQRKELKLQRKELRNTRKELKGQKEEVAKQNQIMRIQQFEYGFFNLKNDLDNKLTNIDVYSKNNFFSNACSNKFDFSKNYIFLTQYFNKLLLILDYIENTELLNTKAQRYKYITIIRDSLSNDQIFCLFHYIEHIKNTNSNAQFDYFCKFEYFINEYAFFKNVDKSEIQKQETDKTNPYQDSAFDDSILRKKINEEKNSKQ